MQNPQPHDPARGRAAAGGLPDEAAGAPPSALATTTLVEIQTTCGSQDEARRIARAAVERRLCACAHIEPIESVYIWSGQLQQDTEFRLTLKTTAARFGDIQALIHEMHSYELPALVVLPVVGVSEEYEDWVVRRVT
jgi:periplasmic divalent cation tolerance protein